MIMVQNPFNKLKKKQHMKFQRGLSCKLFMVPDFYQPAYGEQ